MNIIEATKKALEENKAITNPESLGMAIAFVPTNSGPLGILIVGTETYPVLKKGIYVEKKPAPQRYWNPTGADLLREDWELY